MRKNRPVEVLKSRNEYLIQIDVKEMFQRLGIRSSDNLALSIDK